jgi:putative thioredoxin
VEDERVTPPPSPSTPPGPAAAFRGYGAVDLGALAAQRAARERAEAATAEAARAAEAGEVPPVVTMTAVTEETFQSEVIDRSFVVPVVIDFWAEWCQPCKQLSPVLEKLAGEAAGAWVLATIDTDANPRIAQAFKIQSIPTVFVVWQGQLIPGFSGALAEAELRSFAEQVAARPAQAGAGAAADPAGPAGQPVGAAGPIDPLEEAALDALDAGDLDAAAAAFEQLVQGQPDNTEARIGLSRVELLRRTRGRDPAAARAAAAAAPDDVPAQTLAADLDVAAGAVDAAVDRLVDLVRRTSGAERDLARTHLLGLFALLGEDDPRVPRGRTALANALF